MSSALDGLILATSFAHVLLSPYTKVEESFNLHAVHDVLFYGVSPTSLPNVNTIDFEPLELDESADTLLSMTISSFQEP